ncbi:hypothetical protein JO972_01855 [Verrucomicrobiaceae bacterium 5K15]|uniref:Uncharacterized protein n=1 Tax=Oceaniferula flava TaxID=2800421 RepID=A0AAE2SBY9_9BACT|nr:hypothetical protein [Oceaniferula flavus]MBK1853690.1 hypothetical protein [Oceaniferula flavus]MBM1134996.1 hypothetical protein [Oceaniferula flavus]
MITRKSIALLALTAALAVFFFWNRNTAPSELEQQPPIVTLPKPPPPKPEVPMGKLIGEKLLHQYASDDTTLRDDLQAISRLSLSYITLVKNHANHPVGCNADLADAFHGKNPHQQRFLPDRHKVFNDEGEMIDRWQTPLFIHPVSAGRWEIRSAGPDRKLWTGDDLQLLPNGTFVEGFTKN